MDPVLAHISPASFHAKINLLLSCDIGSEARYVYPSNVLQSWARSRKSILVATGFSCVHVSVSVVNNPVVGFCQSSCTCVKVVVVLTTLPNVEISDGSNAMVVEVKTLPTVPQKSNAYNEVKPIYTLGEILLS